MPDIYFNLSINSNIKLSINSNLSFDNNLSIDSNIYLVYSLLYKIHNFRVDNI